MTSVKTCSDDIFAVLEIFILTGNNFEKNVLIGMGQDHN